MACDKTSKPSSNGTTHWYCYNSSSTVIVFVHGLNSSNKNAWTYKNEKKFESSFWPELVKNDVHFFDANNLSPPPSILLASFYTGLESGKFRISDAQKQLRDALLNSVDGNPPAIEKSNIILVGHSLGGVLLRDMLSRHPDRFLGKRLGLLLIASPSKGSSFANIARLGQWVMDNTMIRELEKGSNYLNDVHKRFSKVIATNGPLRFIIGRELVEQLGMSEARERCKSSESYLSTISCSIFKIRLLGSTISGLIVPYESAVNYWPEKARIIPQSNHVSISKPTDTGHDTHQSLRELFESTLRTKGCVPPPNFRLTFNMNTAVRNCSVDTISNQKSKMKLYHLSTDDGVQLRPELPLQFDSIVGVHRVKISEPPFPCSNDIFWGRIAETVKTSRQTKKGLCLTEVCFKRSQNIPKNKFAVFNCVKGDKCNIPNSKSGIANICDNKDHTPIMARSEIKPTKALQWITPSFSTLEKMDPIVRPGFTEFYIISDPLTKMANATSFAYAVSVNDTPVHFDGLPQFHQKKTLSKGSRVHITFPIENLGFRGGKQGDGFENVKVQIRFFEGENTIGTASLERNYIAYRHAPVIQHEDTLTGEHFSWRSIYRPSTSGQNFEVILEHGSSAEWMLKRRVFIDELNKRFDGKSVIGVLRPGRIENPRIGMILGVVQDNGQVQSLFKKQEAKKICQWIMQQAEFGMLQKQFSNIFEFPNETFDDVADRGRRVAYCKDTQ